MPGARDVERERRSAILRLGTFGLIGVAALVAARMWSIDVPALAAMLVVASGAALANLIAASRGADLARTGHVSIGLLFAVVFVGVSSTGGFYDVNFGWLYVVPVSAALLVGMRASAIWALGVSVVMLAFWGLAGAGIEVPHVVPEAERHGQALFNRISLLGGMLVVAAAFVHVQRGTERSLFQRQRALEVEAMCVRLLQDAAVAANEADDLDEAIHHCVARVLDAEGWALGLVWTPGVDSRAERRSFALSDRLHRAPGVDGSDVDELVRRSAALRVVEGELALGRVVRDGVPEWAFRDEMQPESSPRGEAALVAGLTTVIAIPVVVRGRTERIVELFGDQAFAPEAHLIEVLRDVGRQLGRVAERVRLQESVRRSQKLESIGQLAAGIAHEINNPMSYVRANLSTLAELHRELLDEAKREAWPESIRRALEPVDELIAESQDGVDRTITIVRDVREFARDGTARTERVDLREVIDGALRVASAAGSGGADIRVDVVRGLEIEGLASRIRQVVLNLLLNAMHAAGPSGRVEVRASADAGFARIVVRDDGPGIEGADLERIFEPFFTTKAAGEGTGLGLYISHEIVRWHNGRFEVHSEPGAGATFVVELPLFVAPDPC